MLEMEMENERVERLQHLGEDWIEAITEGQLDRLEQYTHADVISRLLLPKRFVNGDKAADLVANYHDWFDDYTNFKLDGSRIGLVGERLGIFYRIRLQKEGDWYVIEQQLYCTLKDGLVEKVNLVCSGFQLDETTDQAALAAAPESGQQDPQRDGLLEFHAAGEVNGSTCAVLTPAIKSKLREMQTGQVLEVRVDDPTAKGDIESWSRLSGNRLLKMVEAGGQELRFFVQKK